MLWSVSLTQHPPWVLNLLDTEALQATPNDQITPATALAPRDDRTVVNQSPGQCDGGSPRARRTIGCRKRPSVVWLKSVEIDSKTRENGCCNNSRKMQIFNPLPHASCPSRTVPQETNNQFGNQNRMNESETGSLVP